MTSSLNAYTPQNAHVATTAIGPVWGQHLIVDAAAGDLSAVRDAATIREFTRELVERIDMKAYGPPLIEHFATHTPEAAGYSLVQLIETSAISGHFVDLTGDFYLDVFSCKPYSNETALSVIDTYFRPRSVTTTVLHRRAPLLTDR